MKVALLVAALCLASSGVVAAQAQKSVRIAVTGQGNFPARFIESARDAGRESGLSLEVVPSAGEGHDYLIVITQVGGLANAVIALDRRGEVAASVVRSGRLSAAGAMNAAARELTKKLAVLVP